MTLDMKIQEYSNYFCNLWLDEKPIARLFRTDSRGYIYDTGTNKILGCDPLEFNYLQKFLSMNVDQAIDIVLSEYSKDQFIKVAQELKDKIENENILKTKKATQFGLSSHYHNIKEMISTKCSLIQLEVTQRCSLRCGYCVFNPMFVEKRNHCNHDMSLSVAIAGIDYLANRKNQPDDIFVSFCGGEPLLVFPLIKSIVDYARRKISKKEIHFALTTNATLLTSEMANYFNKENFRIMVSIDGPEEIHNSYRKDRFGNGSFNSTLSGLKRLVDTHREGFKKISLSMVYAPPYSEEKLDRIAELWDKTNWLSKEVFINIAYPISGTLPTNKNSTSNVIDISLGQWVRKRFLDGYIHKKRPHPIARSALEKRLAILFRRPIYQIPQNKYQLNGCCLPGVRKIFVSVDGNIFLCERMPFSPSIGDIYSGIDIDKVKSIYIDEYESRSLQFCSECWAIRLCNICYMHSFSKGKISIEKKNKYCSLARLGIENDLQLYCELLEIDPNGLDYLSEMIMT